MHARLYTFGDSLRRRKLEESDPCRSPYSDVPVIGKAVGRMSCNTIFRYNQWVRLQSSVFSKAL
jgi:hypothetical protein